MAYGDYLFRFGNYTIPCKYMDADNIHIVPNRRLDLDSYQDGNGVTNRNTLAHTRTTVEFSTGKLYESEMEELVNGIVSNYQNEKERDAQCSYYDTEHFCYKTGHFYLDSNIEISPCGEAGGEVVYAPVTFSFVEY